MRYAFLQKYREIYMQENEYKQKLVLDNRERLCVDGVRNIDTFTDEYLEFSTALGIICVEGEDLKIEELRQDDGEIHITGSISGIFYKENKSARTFLEKIFK
jgi:sporulation protein YabP